MTSTNIRTKDSRRKPDAADQEHPGARQSDGGVQPWQFFTLAGLGCATIVLWSARGQGLLPVALLSAIIACAVLVGLAALRAVRPLVAVQQDRTAVFGHRTRVALEREKTLALRSIKELEFDRAMGKLSDADWLEMSGRLRARAARLMRQLDAGAGYREQIERELTKRIGAGVAPRESARTCSSCQTVNDTDARYCKSCGQKL